LSHVNLLARGRGTLNLYLTAMDALPGLQARLGWRVCIEGAPDRISLRLVSAEEAEAFRAAHVPRPVQLREARGGFSGLVPLADGDCGLLVPECIGAKAANYAALFEVFGPGLVRPGYALGFQPYFDVMAQGAGARLDELLASGAADVTGDGLREVRERIMAAQVPEATLAAVRQFASTLYPRGRIRLRSSTNCEDLPYFNGAGLYTSTGFNTWDGVWKLERKLLEVYASLWNLEAYRERAFAGMDQRKAAMAVLINEAFTREMANGVVLATPADDGQLAITVNAQPGDHAVVNPLPGEEPESFACAIPHGAEPRRLSRSSIGPVFLDEGPCAPVLDALLAAAARAHGAFAPEPVGGKQYGVEMEFKVMASDEGPRLYLKQVRALGMVLPE